MWDYGSQFTLLKGFRFNFTSYVSCKMYVAFLGDLFYSISYCSTLSVGISVSTEASLTCVTGGRKWLQRESWVLQNNSNSTKQKKSVLCFLHIRCFTLIFISRFPSCLLINHVTNICHVRKHLCVFAAT